MANIINLIEKEITKGGEFVTKSGDILTHAQIEKALKKQYIDELKKDIISADKSFAEYIKTKCKDYTPLSLVRAYVSNKLCGDEKCGENPDCNKADETVAE